MRQVAAATLLVAAGCGSPAPPPAPPAVRLSTQNTGANVAPIADFFRRTCLGAPADDEQMNAAIAESGWAVRQLNSQNWEGPSYWEFDHGDLSWFHTRRMNACFLSLDSLVSPTPAALAAGLRPVVQRPGIEERREREDKIIWTWPADGNRRMVLMICAIRPESGRTYGRGRQAVSLSLSSEPMSAARAEREC